MSLDVLLFVLRLISGVLLLGMVTALFVMLWRDYQTAATSVQVNRRVYGQLIKLTYADRHYLETGETYPLHTLTTIGRGLTNTIVIMDTFASSDHAQIVLRSGQWWLEDRNSRNGTLLNGDILRGPAIVTDGDIVGVGQIGFRILLS